MPGFPSIDDSTPSMEAQFGEIDMAATELKSCPFCDAPAELEHGNDHHGSWFNLGCSRHWGVDPEDKCIGGRLWYTADPEEEPQAIKEWNSRAES